MVANGVNSGMRTLTKIGRVPDLPEVRVGLGSYARQWEFFSATGAHAAGEATPRAASSAEVASSIGVAFDDRVDDLIRSFGDNVQLPHYIFTNRVHSGAAGVDSTISNHALWNLPREAMAEPVWQGVKQVARDLSEIGTYVETTPRVAGHGQAEELLRAMVFRARDRMDDVVAAATQHARQVDSAPLEDSLRALRTLASQPPVMHKVNVDGTALRELTNRQSVRKYFDDIPPTFSTSYEYEGIVTRATGRAFGDEAALRLVRDGSQGLNPDELRVVGRASEELIRRWNVPVMETRAHGFGTEAALGGAEFWATNPTLRLVEQAAHRVTDGLPVNRGWANGTPEAQAIADSERRLTAFASRMMGY